MTPLARTLCAAAPSTARCSGRSRARLGHRAPAVDFLLLCISGGARARRRAHDVLHVSAVQAPLLAMPPLVMLLFYLRGLYRTRLRALVLDGVVPVLSAISVAAMAVAVLGTFLNDHGPQAVDVAARLVPRAALRRRRTHRPGAVAALGASPAPCRQAGADPRRRRRRGAGGAPAGDPPRVRAGAGRLPRRGPALGRRGRRARRAGARHDRRPRRDRRAHRHQEPDRRLLLGRRRARQPPDPALPGARRRGLGRAADVRHDQRPRRATTPSAACRCCPSPRSTPRACSSRSSTRSTACSRCCC